MHVTKPLAGLVALGLLGAVAGALVTFATEGTADAGPVATLAFVAAVVIGLVLAGARSREWLSNQYW